MIPEPSFGKACGIVVVAAILGVGMQIVLRSILNDPTLPTMLFPVFNLIFSALIWTTLVTMMLPTTFGRAVVVYVFQVLLVLAIVAVVAAVMFCVGAVAG